MNDTIRAPRQRLIGLDLVRGICAVAVMIYHYCFFVGWGDLVGMGTFGVYIFFALSGFALFYVYHDIPIGEKMLRDFFISRFLRIFPLFFVVALYRTWGADLSPYTIVRLIIHATPLAGIADVSSFSSVAVGGWSILIEWSFYLLFPFLLLFRSTTSLAMVFALTLAVNVVFVLAAYYPPEALAEAKRFPATDTFNFLCYFVGGMLGAHIFTTRADAMAFIRKMPAPLIIALGLVLFIFILPEVIDYGSRRRFLSGWNAAFLILVSCLLVFLAALQNPTGAAAKISIFLGDVSFALYLLHPYVYTHVAALIPSASAPTILALSALGSLVLAKIVHTFFEVPIRDIRKRRGIRLKARIA